MTMWVSRASSARAARSLSELERPADPGALVLARLQSLRLHQRVGVLVPAAVREVVAEHRGRSLRLVDDAKRHIGLGEAQQCLLDVASGLIAGHHPFETVDRGRVVL